MGIDIKGVDAYFQNGFNHAVKAADRYNPLTDKGRNNIGNDARNTANGTANKFNGAVNYVKAGTRQNITAAGNTLNAAGNNIKAAGRYSVDAVGSFVGGQAAYAPTINPTKGQHDRNKMNPQGSYNNSKGVSTPERPQLKRKLEGNG